MNAIEQIQSILKPSPRMPVLFVGHGNPMNAIEDNQFVHGFEKITEDIPEPQAILCISAHWYTKGSYVTAVEQPKTIHDFYGFPPIMYEQNYPAPGHPQLATTTKELLAPDPVLLDHEWGFDHGTWTILKHMYPAADIPVIQLSIDYSKPPEFHFNLGKQLAKLREFGVLVIGSGNIIHNLVMVDFGKMDIDNYGFDWALEAREIFNQHILNGDFNPLINYKGLGTAIQLAVPTPDHYLPLLYNLGLKGQNESIGLFNDKLLAGSLSMTSVIIGDN
jgi:4,5-DOPA dioxygenase extradiol